MRSEIQQVLDHSNVVLWQEYQVRGTADGDVPTLTVVRTLVLVTLFVADSGYIMITQALDPTYQRGGHTIVAASVLLGCARPCGRSREPVPGILRGHSASGRRQLYGRG